MMDGSIFKYSLMYMKLHFNPWELKACSCMHLDMQRELEELEWFPNGEVQSALGLILLKYGQCQYAAHIHLWWQYYSKLCILIESNHTSYISMPAYIQYIPI